MTGWAVLSVACSPLDAQLEAGEGWARRAAASGEVPYSNLFLKAQASRGHVLQQEASDERQAVVQIVRNAQLGCFIPF